MQSGVVRHCVHFLKCECCTHTCNCIEMHNTRACQHSRTYPRKCQSSIGSVKIRDSNGDIRGTRHCAHCRSTSVIIEMMDEERTNHDIRTHGDFLAKQVDTKQIDALADCVRIHLSNFKRTRTAIT